MQGLAQRIDEFMTNRVSMEKTVTKSGVFIDQNIRLLTECAVGYFYLN